MEIKTYAIKINKYSAIQLNNDMIYYTRSLSKTSNVVVKQLLGSSPDRGSVTLGEL